MTKRVWSLLMALALCLLLLPVPVWAAETNNNVAAVTIGSTTTQYADIDTAFAEAQEADSATVKLLADVTISHTGDTYGIQLEKGDITLDLNGKTISQRAVNQFYAYSAVFYLSSPGGTTSDEFAASLKAAVHLTVQDDTGRGRIVQPNGGPAIIVTGNSTLTVNGGTIENKSSDDFDDDSDGHMTPNCAVLLDGGGKAVIDGGTLSGMRGVAVTGYITKEEEGLIEQYYGIEGYNNETYGNELTVTGGEISGTSGNALIVYEKAKKIELSGGAFSTASNEHSIWVADTEPEGEDPIKGDAASLLASGYRYENNGAECAYSAEGNGVVGNATVKQRPANEYAYIGADGKLATRANCTEITAETFELPNGWYVVKGNVEVTGLNITNEVNLILCDGATLAVTEYLNVTQSSKLNLYWQSAGTGKLTAKAVSSDSTITAPVGEMKKTTDASGTTYEKCFEHDWEYTNNGDTHTATCKLCGKAEAAASHEYKNWTSTDATTHTGKCVCGATKTENHILTCTPNDDGLTHSSKCSVCGYETAAENHSFDENGKCTTCQAQMVAKVSDKYYTTLAAAINAAKNGGTVTLQAYALENIIVTDGNVTVDLNGKTWVTAGNRAEPTLTVKGGSVTVKNGSLETGSTSNAATTVVVEGGRLTAGEGMTVKGGSTGIEGRPYTPAIEVKGGELTLSTGTKLDCGMRVPENKTLADYLPEGTAFTVEGSAIDGYVQSHVSAKTLVVAEHSHKTEADGKCACGYECTTHEFENGVCTTCGYVCPHTSVTEADGVYTCDTCRAKMTVRITHSDKTEEYFASDTLEDSFKNDIFSSNVADGDTVTLLADGLKSGFVDWNAPDGTSATLDLNGHTLDGENSNITIREGSTLRVVGSGSYTGAFHSKDSEAVLDLSGWTSGTIGSVLRETQGSKMIPSKHSGTKIGRLRLWMSAQYLRELDGGTYGEIIPQSSSYNTTASALLLEGYVFQKSDGSYVPYDTPITTESPLENVTVVKCPHTEINNHGFSTDRWCSFCDKQIAASVKTAAGAFTYYEDFNTALEVAQKSAGCTLTLYMDDCKLDITGGSFTLDVNGRSPDEVWSEYDVHYALRVQKGAAVTVKDLHVAGDLHDWHDKGYAGSIYVESGASLTLVGCEVQDLRTARTDFEDALSTVELNNSTIYGTLKAYYCNLTIVNGRMEGLIAANESTVEICGGRFIGAVDASWAKSLKLSGGSFVSITAPTGKTIKDCLADGYVVWKGSNVIDSNVSSLSSVDSAMYVVDSSPFKNVKAVNPNVTTTYGQSVTLNTSMDYRWDSTHGLTLTWYCDDVQQGDPIAITTVPKTYSLTVTPASAGTHTYRLVFAENGYSEECVFTVTVGKAASAVVTPPTANTLTYNHAVQNLVTAGTATGGTMQYSLEQNGTYSADIPTGTNADKYTVWYKVKGDGNHNDSAPQSVTVTIAPKTADNPTIEIASGSSYNGQAQTPTVTVKDGENTIDPTEYTVSYDNNTNAGEGTVTIKNADGGNYTVKESTKNFTIAKAAAPKLNNVTHSQKYTVTEGTVSLANAGMPAGAGTLTYAKGAESVNGVSSWNVDNTGKVTYTLSGGQINDTVTLPVSIGSTNYQNATVNIVITLTDRDAPTVTANAITVTYTGSAVPAEKITGTAKLGETDVVGTWSWVENQSLTNVSDSGEKTVIFTPTDAINYKPVEAKVQLTINKATPTGAPKYTAISGSGKTLADAGLTTEGGTFSVPGTVAWELPADTEVKSNTAYKWEFTPNNTDNYNSIEGSVTLWHRSSSSSSGSTTPATPGKTEITTNPDGSIKITPPKNSGETKVVVPVKDVTPGTVAIIVKADGTEEIVKDALATKDGIELTVDGSVTVKIVDNAKKFVDTKGHWAEDAIDFVSARGLVNGMTETTFAPNAPTTRAQLWTILARQADADLTGGSTWYEKAQEWAKTSGISDGSDPDGNITRAQMVTMLWRAAGSPAVSGSSGFTDVPGDSYYAQAVAWAAEKGITTGVGDGKFDPNGTCTRAQIATFLYRTYVNKI